MLQQLIQQKEFIYKVLYDAIEQREPLLIESCLQDIEYLTIEIERLSKIEDNK